MVDRRVHLERCVDALAGAAYFHATDKRTAGPRFAEADGRFELNAHAARAMPVALGEQGEAAA